MKVIRWSRMLLVACLSPLLVFGVVAAKQHMSAQSAEFASPAAASSSVVLPRF